MSSAKRYEPVLQRFTEKMRAKLALPKNVRKPHWRDGDFHYLVDRLEEELKELKDAINSGDPDLIEWEAVDVANLAMMIGDYFR